MLALGTGPAAVAQPEAGMPAATFTSCKKVNAKYSGGIAESKAAANRVKGRQKVSPTLYRKYRTWDRNRDGVVCGPKGDSKPATTGGGVITSERGFGYTNCPTGSTFVNVWGISVPPGWYVLQQGPRGTGYEVIIANVLTGDKQGARFSMGCKQSS
jgi:hypothetical protein